MSTKARKITTIFTLVILCLAMLLLASCKDDNKNPDDSTVTTGNDDPDKKPGGAVDYGIDNVFFMQENGKEYLFTVTGNEFMFSGLDGDKSGTFTYNKDTGALALTFKDGGNVASAVLADNVLNLTYNNGSYRLVKREYFTVTYLDGATTLSTENVLNSTFANKPSDPSKDGFAFIGWYADAEYATPFTFDQTVISNNTSVYARFEATTPGMLEYKAYLYNNGTLYDTIETVNGIVYNLPTPEGDNFAGWWVSDYQNSAKLTYEYTGQALSQNTSLYAVYKTAGTPLISVTGTGISWDAQGPAVNYRVSIKLGDTEVATSSTGDTSYNFNFADKAPGEYEITVTANNASSTIYYKNKTLDRVSNFQVVSSSVLVFNPVPNAEKYYISILCGNDNHTHTNEFIGNSTNYNFSKCDMPAEGIRFVITAKADGYLDSVSDMFTYSLSLNEVQGVAIDNEKITWYPVDFATSYYVEISTDGTNYNKYLVASGTSYSIANIDAGTVYAKVTPVSAGYYSAPAAAKSFSKTTLAKPAGISISDDTIVWDAVAGATGYNVNIAGKVYTATTNSLKISSDMLAGGVSAYAVSVQATGATAAVSSAYSDTVTVNYMTMGSVYYNDGYVYFSPVVGATAYKIKVGDTVYTAEKNAYRYPVVFTQSGSNTISVSYIDTEDNESNAVSVNVTTYAIELDTRGGKSVGNVYKAIGDSLTLPETNRDGYTFVGWYTTPDAIENNGVEFKNAVMDASGSRVVYAAWSAMGFGLTLEAGTGTVSSPDATVTYGLINQIQIPSFTDTTRMFYGWYTEPNGAGTRLFDENGKGTNKWTAVNDMTLYAYYPEILQFFLLGDGNSYSVAQGQFGIGTANEITIPTQYNGKPVTTIEAGAFASCSSLQVINIPNTIEVIELGLTGTNQSGSAFQSCSYLRAINIFNVEGAVDPVYHSVDGVLYKKTDTDIEIACYPYAKTGVLIIEEGTTLIPVSVFRYSKIIEVQIPYTVKSISGNAFYSCASLQKIVFLPTPEGVTPQDLTLSEKAIYSCSKLESIYLPSRVKNLTADSITSCSALTSIEVEPGNPNFFSLGEENRKVVCTKEGTETVLVLCPKGMEGSYTIPRGVTVIGENAFASCTKITELNIPGYVTEIRANAFKSCSGITDINFEEDGSPLTIRTSAFYSCTGLTTLTLPSSLVKMEANAFGSTTKLTHVTINAEGLPKSETDPTMVLDFATASFGTTAANPSYYVTNVTIGKNVPEFELVGVFGSKVANITVEAGNKFYADVDGVLFNADKTAILFYPTARAGEYVLPETVTTIGANVFYSKTALTKITIGKNITLIGENAFRSCSKLTEIVFEAGGTEKLVIADGAFYSCLGLTSLQLPTRTGGLEIGNEAFRSCSKITTLVIPEGTTKLGYSVFTSCSLVKSITLPSTLTELPLNASGVFDTFKYCNALEEIKFSGENSNLTVIDGILYKKTEGVPTDLMFCPQYKAGTTVVDVPGTVNNVYSEAFYLNRVVTEIKFEDLAAGKSITFGEDAFGNCEKLNKVALPKGLTSIVSNMFYYCTSLEELVIPNTVETIENQAFYYCKMLNKLTFEEGNTETPLVINDATSYTYAPFYGCNNLKNIAFPERMTVLGNYAFGGYSRDGGETNSAIESVSFPSTLKRIGNYAFYLAKSLNTVTFAPGTELEDTSTTVFGIGNSAFYHTDVLASIVLPDNDTTKYTMGTYALSYSGISSVVIPSALKEMKASAFAYSKKLSTVTFAEGSTPILNTYAFIGTAISTVDIPEGIPSIPDYSFQNCKELVSVSIPSSATEIGISAFNGCTLLENITLKKDESGFSKVAEIGNTCFVGTAISSFEMPTLSGTTNIKLGTNVFKNCSKLTNVTISKSVSGIEGTFAGCTTINNFTVDAENQNFYFDTDDKILYNKEKTAFRYICSGSISGEYVIPSTITEIPDNIFDGNLALTKVIIPNTVTRIGDYAFQNCANLTEVIFVHSTESPSQLSDFGAYVFQYCGGLKNVTLPGNLKTIPNYTFRYCYSLESVNIPDSVTSIGTYAFYQANLSSVVIPSGVKTIGNYAFQGKTAGGSIQSLTFAKDPVSGTSALTSIGSYSFRYQPIATVVIPKSVTTLSSYCFGNNAALTSFTFEEGTKIATFPTYLVAYSDKLESFTIPKSVKTLSGSTFRECTALENVMYEEGSLLNIIKTYEFADCTSLETIHIPAGVTALGNYSFNGCTSLKNVIFDGNNVKTLGTYTFQDCTSLVTFTIPDSVTMLGSTATAAAASTTVRTFSGCTSLKTINFGPNFTKIGAYAFENCTALESITFPKSLTQIGNYDFDGCTSLKEVIFESGSKLDTMGTYAFRNSGLEAIEIPAGLTSLGTYDFDGCAALKSVTFAAGSKLTLIGSYCFRNSGLESIIIPEKVDTINIRAFDGCTSLRSVEFAPSSTALSFYSYEFNGCTSLENVVFNGRVKAIPDYAFAGCTALKDINLANVVTIGGSSFSGCKGITSIEFPETLTQIGANGFLNAGLTSINIPKKLTDIGVNVFAGCGKLATIEVDPNNDKYEVRDGNLFDKDALSVITVPYGAFTGIVHVTAESLPGSYAYNSAHITSLIIDEGITELPDYAFFGATIDSVVLPSTLEVINTGLFYGAKFDEIVIPAKVTSIESSAFRNCSFKKITFAEGSELTTLGTYAFAGSGLESITLPAGVTMLGTTEWLATYTFDGCEALTKVRFEGEVYALNPYAFRNCIALTDIVIPSTTRILGTYLFFGCTSLETIVIPEGIESLCTQSSSNTNTYAYTFRGCTSLKNVTLPSTLKYINYYAFYDCTSLESINIPASVEQILNYAFFGCTSLKNVNFAENNSIEKFGTYVFSESGLETITLPGAPFGTASYAFKDCPNLKSVSFTGKLVTIPTYAFQNCTALESFTIPDSVETILGYAFQGSGLKSMIIPATVDTLNTSTFLDCVNLESVVFEEGCATLSGNMFAGCTALKSVTLPSSIATINTSAFKDCTALTKIYITNPIVYLWATVFSGWTSNQTVYFTCTNGTAGGWISTWGDSTDAVFVFNYTE